MRMPARSRASGRDEDALAYRRAEPEYRNPLLVEQPNGNFADTMVRQLIFSAYAAPLYEKLAASSDARRRGSRPARRGRWPIICAMPANG